MRYNVTLMVSRLITVRIDADDEDTAIDAAFYENLDPSVHSLDLVGVEIVPDLEGPPYEDR